MRLVVIPRWGGTAADDFYPWLMEVVRRDHLDTFDSADVFEMPSPQTPELGLWVAATRIAIGVAEQAEDTMIVGHSVGFQAVMRALAELEDEVVVAAAVGIAPWWTIDAPWPSIRPWIDTELEHRRVRKAARRIHCLLSDDDPFTRDYATTKRDFEERLGARVRVVPGGRHFNGTREPEVLRELLAAAAP